MILFCSALDNKHYWDIREMAYKEIERCNKSEVPIFFVSRRSDCERVVNLEEVLLWTLSEKNILAYFSVSLFYPQSISNLFEKVFCYFD